MQTMTALSLLFFLRHNEMSLIAPPFSLDDSFGYKRLEVGKCGILQPSRQLCISRTCNKAMLPDILQDNLLQGFLIPFP